MLDARLLTDLELNLPAHLASVVITAKLLHAVRSCLELGRVEDARRVATILNATDPRSGPFLHALVMPPTARTGPATGRGDLRANLDRLAHPSSSSHRWLALRAGSIVASEPTLKALADRLREIGVDDALVVER